MSASTDAPASMSTPFKSVPTALTSASSRSDAVRDPTYRPIVDSKPFTKGDPIDLLQCMTRRDNLASYVKTVRTALSSPENDQKGKKWEEEWSGFETKKTAYENAALEAPTESKSGTPISWMNDMITMVLVS